MDTPLKTTRDILEETQEILAILELKTVKSKHYLNELQVRLDKLREDVEAAQRLSLKKAA